MLAFDAALKKRNLNPGTTADFVVATLFAASICERLGLPGTV
ncbi:MAG: triphosphoribosyl-dephospho-CoA synthase [Bradyrhizobium sp.]